MVSFTSYSMLFIAWCLTFASLIYAWRRIAHLSEHNARLMAMLQGYLRADDSNEKKNEGS
jgi:hypothetical protein